VSHHHRIPVRLGCVLLAMLLQPVTVGLLQAAPRATVRIPLSHSEVLSSTEDLRTVAIADPRIADAAVGSSHTVVVTAKSAGTTSLVLYAAAGTFTQYEIEVFEPGAERQVLLHVRIAEVTDQAQRELGVDWYGRGERSAFGKLEGQIQTGKVVEPNTPFEASALTDGLIGYTNPANSLFLQGAWRALEEQGQIRTLAHPSLLAKSGEKAEFLAGGEIPVPIAQTAGTGGATMVTVQWKKFGIGVEFTPEVLPDGRIRLQVAPEVSQLDYANAVVLSGFTVPSLVSRRASTTVELGNGEHLVIGGLRQDESTQRRTRIPWIGRIPLLGLLFSADQTDHSSRELLLVVSPELVEKASATLPALPTDSTPAGQAPASPGGER
jgi:pilus assembly protein CpaC